MDELMMFEQRFEARLRRFALTGVQPVDSAAIAHAVAAVQPRARTSASSGGPVALALDGRAWMIAVVLGLLVLLGGTVLVGSRLLQPPAPSPIPMPAPSPIPTPETGSLEPPHTHAVISGGPGLVAVGATDNFDDMADIWTSSDGRTWSRVAGELGPGVIHDVTCGGPGLVAVGDGIGQGAARGAVWTSPDGLVWTRLPDDPVFDRGWIEAVTAAGPGLVAVGPRHQAWFSADGLSWTRATLPLVPPDVYAGLSGTNPQVNLDDVAAAGDRLVAVGDMLLNDNSRRAFVWSSADGMTWTDVPLDPEAFPPGSYFRELTGGPAGFIAIGAGSDHPDAPPWMWTSSDGLHWARANPATPELASPGPSPTPSACRGPS